MELFIQIRNEQPFEHPIFGGNFRQAFPNIDTDNLPESFARFVRVEPPVAGIYELYEGATYEWLNGVVTDVHHVRPMTLEEVASKQNLVKLDWAKNGYGSWIFDEAICAFKAPTPYPTDDKLYQWDEPTTSWIEISNA